MGSVTRDALFAGELVLTQPARRGGYRVNVDAILLAAFAAYRLGSRAGAGRRGPARHAVDLGSGVGAVGLALLHFGAARRCTMVEVDPVLGDLARENARDNRWADRIDVVTADVRDAPRVLDADLVVCNPPYVTPGRGRIPGEPVRRAKYGELEAFVEAARRIAGRRARACFVYPANEAMRLLPSLRASGLEPKRLCAVHGRPTDAARVVLVEALAGKPGGLAIDPPLFETEARPGTARSEKLAALLSFRGTGTASSGAGSPARR
jgi:tRNA1(Val) A37 N6-methylase TrmN6